MTILSSLARAYDRLPDAPPFGYSSEKIGFVISLNADGSVAHVIDLREGEGRKKNARTLSVPTSFKRSGTTPRPFFLWDNANYALGVGSIDDETDLRFQSFREKHLSFLDEECGASLAAFRNFLRKWEPKETIKYIDPDELRTAKVIFSLESERLSQFLHETSEAKALWGRIKDHWMAIEGKNADEAICLVTGLKAPVARTHPAIRGIPSKSGKDADSLVSFNLDAFTSHGHEQGDNAPVSEAAAFAYTTALNRFLERDSGHRIQIGDASTVFWADASEMEVAEYAEAFFAGFWETAEEDRQADEKVAAGRVGDKLARIRDGLPLEEVEPKLAQGVRFYVLGLAPNAARLSVRFFYSGDFGTLTRNYCVSAWNKDPAHGVIGVQTGPPSAMGLQQPPVSSEAFYLDACCGDNSEDTSAFPCAGQDDQGDLPGVGCIAESGAEGSAQR